MNAHLGHRSFGVRHWKSILGIRVASIERQEAISLLQRVLSEKRFTKLTFLNAHNANIACSDEAFAAALEDFLVLPDGVGVDIAAKLLYGAAFPANLNGTDFIPALLGASPQALTVGLIGTKRANADNAAERLRALFPQHRIVVIHDGFFTPAEEPAILVEIEELRPDMLLVAMGVPRQELWIHRNITERHCTVPVAVGALLDFLSGAVPRAPLLVRQMRLEWLFRLVNEPGRLWRRYVVGNPLFLTRVARQKLSAGKAAR